MGLMGVLPSDAPDDAAWDVLVARARDLVSRLRVGGRRVDDAEASAATVAALEAITAEAAAFVHALGLFGNNLYRRRFLIKTIIVFTR